MRRILSLTCLFTSLYCLQATAAVVVTIDTPPPPPKEVIIIPKGNINCVVTPASIYNGIYVTPHKICRYSNPSKKIIWVSGHWQCENYRPLRGICMQWMWIPSHWTTLQTYGNF